CIRFHENTIRPISREAQGVRSIRLSEGEYIVDMAIIIPGSDMLTISENGFGKRSDADEYRVQGRNGKGVKAGIFTEETGNLVNLKQVTDEDDVMLIADDGQIIRIAAKEISKIGRNTKGVRVMRTGEKSKIVAVAITPHEEVEEGEEEITEEAPAEE
ncbi:MAG: DNA gyrase subunit A, partial [Clostridia bacterium]|nr:DNA gyrase subunit A [Clostridia bacterium]